MNFIVDIKQKVRLFIERYKREKSVNPNTPFLFTHNYFTTIIKATTKDIINKLLLKVYDPITMMSFQCSIGDLMLERSRGLYNRQFIVACRLIDIEKYRRYHDTTFYFQNTLTPNNQRKRNELNKAFCELIESIDEIGYDIKKSSLIVNKDFYLLDGTHRVALMIEKGVDVVQVKRMKRKCIVPVDSLNFLQSRLSADDYPIVWEKFKLINEQLINKGACFGVFIKDVEVKECRQVLKLMTPYVDFKRVLIIEGANASINGFRFQSGVYALFVPHQVDYKIKKKKYYSSYIRHVRDGIINYFINQNVNPNFFYITNNCLECQEIYNSINCFIKEEKTIFDYING